MKNKGSVFLNGLLEGFTLVEVLIAVFILAIIALSLMALLPFGYREVTDAGRLSIMSHLGYEKIDKLKALNYNDWDLLPGVHPTIYRLIGAESSGSEFTNYSRKWTVEEDVPRTGVKTVTMEVGYMLYDTSNNQIENLFQKRQVFVTYITR